MQIYFLFFQKKWVLGHLWKCMTEERKLEPSFLEAKGFESSFWARWTSCGSGPANPTPPWPCHQTLGQAEGGLTLPFQISISSLRYECWVRVCEVSWRVKERERRRHRSQWGRPARMSAGAWQKAHSDTRWTPPLTYSEPTEESVQSQGESFLRGLVEKSFRGRV